MPTFHVVFVLGTAKFNWYKWESDHIFDHIMTWGPLLLPGGTLLGQRHAGELVI